MSPAQGAIGCGAHSALCSRRTRNPSFQGPIGPGTHVPPQSLPVCVSVPVHVRVRRGSRYLAVGRECHPSHPFFLPLKVQPPFPVRPWARPPLLVRMVG
jgi:hypothetical protein